jgi:hypothetical protein
LASERGSPPERVAHYGGSQQVKKAAAACKGEWIGEDVFLLRINLVGGITCYEMRLKFSAEKESITALPSGGKLGDSVSPKKENAAELITKIQCDQNAAGRQVKNLD